MKTLQQEFERIFMKELSTPNIIVLFISKKIEKEGVILTKKQRRDLLHQLRNYDSTKNTIQIDFTKSQVKKLLQKYNNITILTLFPQMTKWSYS